jgi:N-acetylglucosamine malate deacetylase 1
VPGGAPAHRVGRLHHYPMHYPVEPTFVVDVSSVWERRMRAASAYESQINHALDARGLFYGAMIGVRRGEPFSCAGPLGLDMIPGLQGPRVTGRPAYRMFI